MRAHRIECERVERVVALASEIKLADEDVANSAIERTPLCAHSSTIEGSMPPESPVTIASTI